MDGDGGVVLSRITLVTIILLSLYSHHSRRGGALVEGSSGSGGRIVGGENASRFEFPSIARIAASGNHKCGASVINREWVVTAAHCIVDPSSQAIYPMSVYRVYVGNIYFKPLLGQQELNVTRIIVHERYNRTYRQTLFDDIALIQVHPQIRYGQYVQPANFPKKCREELDPAGEGELWAVGWGKNATYPTPPEGLPSIMPNTLQKLKVTVISNEECRNAKPEHGWIIPDTTICVRDTPTNGGCEGDSGSPLYLRKGSTLTQVGVTVARSIGICEGGFTFYLKLSYYIGWISRRISGCGNFPSTGYPQGV